MVKVKWILLITVTVLLLASLDANAEFVVEDKETLRGIKAIFVAIEPIRPEAEKFGLTQDKIRSDVELKLKRAGIKVLSKEEWLKTTGSPRLYININQVYNNQVGAFICDMNVNFNQKVNLTRNPEVSCMATTWWTSATGAVGGKEMEEKVRDTIKDQVDLFLSDYLAVNHKQKSKSQGGI
jgi:hypothetical protein